MVTFLSPNGAGVLREAGMVSGKHDESRDPRADVPQYCLTLAPRESFLGAFFPLDLP